MAKIQMTITLEVDDSLWTLSDVSEVDYLFNTVLCANSKPANGELLLHSNDIGDTVGEIIKVENVGFVD